MASEFGREGVSENCVCARLTAAAVTRRGEAVTDANGRFLVSPIPDGDYLIDATPPANEPYFAGATLGFVSSGSMQRLAAIYLPRKP
jgi:hypothetical protein